MSRERPRHYDDQAVIRELFFRYWNGDIPMKSKYVPPVPMRAYLQGDIINGVDHAGSVEALNWVEQMKRKSVSYADRSQKK